MRMTDALSFARKGARFEIKPPSAAGWLLLPRYPDWYLAMVLNAMQDWRIVWPTK